MSGLYYVLTVPMKLTCLCAGVVGYIALVLSIDTSRGLLTYSI